MRPRLRARRGAVLVLTALTMMLMMMFGAFAVDLAHLYSLRNELQTSADAAAMAAALQMNRDASQATTVGQTFAGANGSDDGAVMVDSIRYGVWDPVSRTLVATSSPASGDAVRVGVHRQATWVFGGVFGLLQPNVKAVATAWADAPVASAPCGKPWAVPYASVMEALGKGDNDPLTGSDIARLRDTIGGNRVWITVHAGDPSVSLPGNFYSIDLPPVNDSTRGGSRGAKAYEENIAECNEIRLGDTTVTEPGKKVGPTVKGAEKMCQPLGSDGTCYNGKGGVGIPIAVPVWRPVDVNKGGRTSVTASFVATIVITKVTSDAEVTGYLYAMNSAGPIGKTSSARNSTVVRSILVQ